MLHVSNPIGHPSMMFRCSAVRTLGVYLREEFKYAEDFDFTHRMRSLGDIAILPERLVVYRKHGSNLTTVRLSEMIDRCAAVLSEAYFALLGVSCEAEAKLVAEHLMGHNPPQEAANLFRLGEFLNCLLSAFSISHELKREQIDNIKAYTEKLWWNMLTSMLRQSHFGLVARTYHCYDSGSQTPLPLGDISRSVIWGAIPKRFRATLANVVKHGRRLTRRLLSRG
jgi:hypothetical protein